MSDGDVENENREDVPRTPTRLKDLAHRETEPLRPESSLEEAGDKMRSLRSESFPVVEDQH
ncbi:MAG: hypothetical protein M3463_06825, partial [Verrucomicrobiota bacterium]|nr:hypothetical protein [Verrucomicrobiota bacterium]